MDKQFDVIIIGAGPAGIFAALELCKNAPHLRTLMVDAGRSVEKRACPARQSGVCVHCQPCGIMNGWAGAGAFSDGKLSLSYDVGGNITSYMDTKSAQNLIDYTDTIYTGFGAPDTVHGRNNAKVDEIRYEASKYNIKLIPCPVRHMGTEHSYNVLKAMYEHLRLWPGFHFQELTAAQSILVENGKAIGVSLRSKDGETAVYANHIILAPGRGGAAWLSDIAKKLGLSTTNNEVDIGVRVEVPNSVTDHLTKALYEAKLVYYSDTFENKVRTFCMNPGGMVSEEHYENGIAVVNGHSYHDAALRTDNTNFALLVSTKFTQPFNQPIEYGNYIAQLGNMLTGGGIMVQRLGDLLKGRRTDASRLEKSTTIPTLQAAVPGDLSFVLPHRHLTSIIETLKALDHIAPGMYSKNTLLYGMEVKFYSSKLLVENNFETAIKNLYAIGDGAGITRGLMQASATGVVVGRDIAAKSN
ncbi:MAG: NAD(P)/FAD-dependent oxidoreductase [Christensenellales bacterium]